MKSTIGRLKLYCGLGFANFFYYHAHNLGYLATMIFFKKRKVIKEKETRVNTKCLVSALIDRSILFFYLLISPLPETGPTVRPWHW